MQSNHECEYIVWKWKISLSLMNYYSRGKLSADCYMARISEKFRGKE